MMWVWISVMNPHRLTWGFAYDAPFALIIAVVTLLGIFFSAEPRRFPWSPVTVTLLLFVLWMNVTTIFALRPGPAYVEWQRVMKTMLMLFAMLTVLYKRQHIQWLAWVLALSIGFYGVKGGVFTILHSGQFRVWGPPGSYIEDNNALAVALIMAMPLLWYLRSQATKWWVSWGLLAATLLTAAAALGSYSRGAFLAMGMMLGFLWWKSNHKMLIVVLLVLVVPFFSNMMPDRWFARMDTIATYQQDSSALGRVNAWWMAFNLAKDRPLVGGGFEIYSLPVFQRYAPNPTDVHAAHSIYFAALGEQGFVGLALFLTLGLLTWLTAGWIVRNSSKRPGLGWASDLALMCQVALVGYAVGGAFLSLLYFDVPYYIMVVLILLRRYVAEVLGKDAINSRGRMIERGRTDPLPSVRSPSTTAP
jgi:putative inorganic carbon (hco3(-)) transporter